MGGHGILGIVIYGSWVATAFSSFSAYSVLGSWVAALSPVLQQVAALVTLFRMLGCRANFSSKALDNKHRRFHAESMKDSQTY